MSHCRQSKWLALEDYTAPSKPSRRIAHLIDCDTHAAMPTGSVETSGLVRYNANVRYTRGDMTLAHDDGDNEVAKAGNKPGLFSCHPIFHLHIWRSHNSTRSA